MGFTTGAKILANIIDEIADGLIATPGGYWTNGDAAWNTSDKTFNNARRSLRYTNGIEDIYITLEAINTSGLVVYYSAPTYRYAKGLRVGFSSSWDINAHVPSSTTYRSLVQFESQYASNTDPYTTAADMATLQITYYLWIESNGFVITGKPEPHVNDDRQGSFVVVIERNQNKEYADGATNFFCYNLSSYLNYTYDALYPANNFMRPFLYQTGNLGVDTYGTMDMTGIIFPQAPYYAFKSSGNGKVYYVKPIISDTSDERSPIFQSELFFLYSEGIGLVDGDVIALEGSTTKFLCKALDSPDVTYRLPIAMKYVA